MRRGVVGEGAEEPGRSEGSPIAGERVTSRSEEARVSEKGVRRKICGGSPGNPKARYRRKNISLCETHGRCTNACNRYKLDCTIP